MRINCLNLMIATLTIGLAILTVAENAQAQNKNRNRNRGRSDENALKVGQKAPDFKLKSLDGKDETKLSSYAGKKPVVLIFGSYT